VHTSSRNLLAGGRTGSMGVNGESIAAPRSFSPDERPLPRQRPSELLAAPSRCERAQDRLEPGPIELARNIVLVAMFGGLVLELVARSRADAYARDDRTREHRNRHASQASSRHQTQSVLPSGMANDFTCTNPSDRAAASAFRRVISAYGAGSKLTNAFRGLSRSCRR
jgi:hypothetical protein